MTNFELRLTPKSNTEPEKGETHEHPIIGYFAVGFGLMSILVSGVVFVPLGLVCSVAALFMGQPIWGVVGILLAIMGFFTTPVFLIFIGLKIMQIYINSFYNNWFGGWFDDAPEVHLPEV